MGRRTRRRAGHRAAALVTAAIVTTALATTALTLTVVAPSASAVTPTAVTPSSVTARIPAVTPASSPTARIDTAVRAEASEIADEAAALRRDVARAMSGYARTFRTSLTREEQRTLDGYIATANGRLDDVVQETSRLERATRGRSVAQAELAQARSQAAWARAQQAAEESFDSARAILEPHMSLIQKIEALSDYTALMQRFEDLGERIDTLDID